MDYMANEYSQLKTIFPTNCKVDLASDSFNDLARKDDVDLRLGQANTLFY